MKHDYIKALNQGSEIVIISSDELANSAIFYKTEDGGMCCFSRFMGLMKRDDMSDKRLLKHLAKMESEGAQIFVRGTFD